MRFLMASHYFASHNSGIEIVAGELFRELTERKQDITWMAGDATPAPRTTGRSRTVSLRIVNFVEERTGLPFPIPTIMAMSEIGREIRKAEVVILHDCLYLSNIATFFCAKRRGITTIVVQHIGFIPYRNWLLNAVMRLANAAITRPMLSRADQVVFISETTRSFFYSVNYKRPPRTIFNGVDTDLYRTRLATENVAKIRCNYELPPDGPVLLFVGRFVEKKGMSALKRMVGLRPNYTWVFAGWGPLDPSSWNMKNLHVFTGLKGESIAALYRACDLLVLPSTGEGFPLVIQEALASGLAIICGADTLNADPELKDFARGVQVHTGDDQRTAQEFLFAIDETLASESELKNKAEQRRAFAISHYSWGRAADRYMEIASALVSARILEPATVKTTERVS
jgi:glycosyltransferase involved in cell wall biosynthesis